MHTTTLKALGSFMLATWCFAASAVDRFVSLSGGHVSPFMSWADAATNIQAAIDAAAAGDTVWVTNGIYSSGGKVMAGDLTNRVALDKALTVQSVNGPTATTIQGLDVVAGPVAVRCVWLTNGAALAGFTIRGGATRSAGDTIALRSGGGVWAASTNARVANCLMVSNTASYVGGGVYQGAVHNSLLTGNSAPSGGGGAYMSRLNSCTVTSNSNGGFFGVSLTNCIVYFNSTYNWSAAPGPIISYSCSSPLPPGSGNTSADPQLIDGVHIGNTSPCRASGTNVVSGADIDGQAWNNPPSIGCDQWRSELIVTKPQIQFTNDPAGFTVSVKVAGEEPFTCWWRRDGFPIEDDGHYNSTHTATLVGNGFKGSDLGYYQVVVSNVFGMVTSAVTQLTAHCVDVAGSAPVLPYSSWTTAATNIQAAIDAAQPGELVLVTNGVYASGGKVKGGDLTNRVALDKALMVVSVNGPAATMIQGAWSPTTNGPLAVRCAWLTNGATLSGFTICYGATRSLTVSPDQQMNGGGVWGNSTNAIVSNCVIATNAAAYGGGGAYQVTLRHCTLVGNSCLGTGSPGLLVANSGEGGGADFCVLSNCVLTANFANSTGGGASTSTLKNCALTGNLGVLNGGGAYRGTLINCTVVANSVGVPSWPNGSGGGVASAALTNCIVLRNTCAAVNNVNSNYYLGSLSYCCSAPLPPGTSNMVAEPQLLGDGLHLAANSPCRAAGLSAAASAVDIDGQPWGTPPSIGCDEWLPTPLIVSQPRAWVTGRPGALNVSPLITGAEPFECSWKKDDAIVQNDQHYDSAQTTRLVVKEFSLADAGGYQVVASNAFGMVTSSVFQVVVHCVNTANPGSAPPYTNWTTAATNIQDAIDVAAEGAFVLVTNGIYASGGKVTVGDLTNRVALAARQTLLSINGPAATAIQGAWDPIATNGPSAVRCAWLAEGATLSGFTLQWGATRTSGIEAQQNGGGVWAASNTCVVAHCAITGNAANISGGGCYQGSVSNCVIVGNVSAFAGGGAAYARLVNCLVQGNAAGSYGGGAYLSTLLNATIVSNYAASTGGGIHWNAGNSVENSVVYFNTSKSQSANWGGFSLPRDFSYSCTIPLPSAPGAANTAADPQLVDAFHLATTSPCRASGHSNFVSGADLDGDDWSNPPSIGCDEIVEATLVGPLSTSVEAVQTTVLVNHSLPLVGRITGRASRMEWAFGDGPVVTNASYLTAHTWTNGGDYNVSLTAYNADNLAGVATNLTIHVVSLESPTLVSIGRTGANFQFQFSSQNGASNRIEYTTNLNSPITWLLLKSLISTGGVTTVSDSAATNAARFYRVMAQ